MERYERYKDSGVEWIGEIPEGWSSSRLKYQVTINDESLPETTDEDYQIKYVDISSVKSGEGIINHQEFSFANSPSRARRIVRHGDVIVSTVRTYLKSIAKIESPDENLIVSTGFAVIRPRKLNSGYIGYAFFADHLIDEIISRSTGVSYPAINASEIGNISIPIPNNENQTAIANYLDRKTAEIDELIAQKERLVELYEEEKTAIINQAVTKGIDPDARLKDSGVDWLGEIPEGWEVKRLKYFISKAGSGITPKGGASEYQLTGIPLLRSQNIHFRGLKLDDVAYITQETHDEMLNSKVLKGDVLLNITGASIGRCYYVTDSLGEANVNQHVCILRPTRKISTIFLNVVLRSNIGQEQINLEQTGSGREGLNFETLKNFLMPSLELSEQTAIVHHIETETACINAKIAKTKKIIALQKEYRTALISEVVTGKIKVTEEMAQ